jgi:prophage regulatory protein
MKTTAETAFRRLNTTPQPEHVQAGAPEGHAVMTGRMLLWPEVHARVGLSRTTIWRMERTGQFPRRVPLSVRVVGWQESELNAWLARRLAARGGPTSNR